MPFINTSNTIGMLIGNASTEFTGEIIGTVIIIMLILFALALLFGIPFEITSMLMLPFLITVAAYYTSFWGIIGVILLYLAAIITKNFMFR